MRALGLVLVLALAVSLPVKGDALAHGPGWFHSHKAKVETPTVKIVNGVPVAIKTTEARTPEGMGKVILRSTGVSLAVTAVITTFKVGLFILTGVPIL